MSDAQKPDELVSELLRALTVARSQRDEARAALEEWENAAKHVEADHPDEQHCGCVPVLRKLLDEARAENGRQAAEMVRLQKSLELVGLQFNR